MSCYVTLYHIMLSPPSGAARGRAAPQGPGRPARRSKPDAYNIMYNMM